jgi:hypothetical protein
MRSRSLTGLAAALLWGVPGAAAMGGAVCKKNDKPGEF